MGSFTIKRLNHKSHYLLSDKQIDSFFIWAVIGVIIGGRLGYVLLYQTHLFIVNPYFLFEIWNGGMSFHGGLIGMIGAIYSFAKINKINFFYLADLVSLSAPIGLFFGRIANFINTELYGKVTEFPLAVIYPFVDNQPRHPSQLYEAFFEGIILFLILFIYFKKNPKKYVLGSLCALFLILYSIFRFLIEYLREPDFHLGLFFNYFSLGQLLCIPLLISGIIILFRK